MTSLLPQIEMPEIVLGLVSPIGTPLDTTITAIKLFFSAEGYRVHEIKVTDVFKTLKKSVIPEVPLVQKPLLARYESHIAYGNQLRRYTDDPSILASLTVQSIVEIRLKSPKKRPLFEKNVFILHQFKRPEEISLLRAIYGRAFFQVSVFSRRSSRVDFLARKFSEDDSRPNHLAYRGDAERLADRDENELKEKFGQRIAKIFHDADLILNTDMDRPSVKEQVGRFLELLFSSNVISPTKVEYGMFAATSAALRTSDLSRQVGAAIFSKRGEIIAMGSNEVPKAGGGTYWPDEEYDDREFKREVDSNDKRKREIVDELLNKLGLNWEGLDEVIQTAILDSSVMDALEYGRIIHAEMNAISDAARLRGGLAGSTLFTTTFPCHMCAKHIVSSGIEDVYYLEPYPKSLAQRLHADSIDIDFQDRGRYRTYLSVKFIHFYGVTPRRYRELFHRTKRKDASGKLEVYANGLKRPCIDLKTPFYADLEVHVLERLKKAVQTFR